MTKLEEIRGRNLFDVFPDNPNDPHSQQAEIARASYRRVVTTRKPDTMALFKYDIRRPESDGGQYEERYWLPVNSPVLDKETGEVTFIIHRVEDVTEFTRLRGKEIETTVGRQGNSSSGDDTSFRANENELLNIKYALDKSAIVAITDRAGNIIHVNAKFCEISKYSRDELLGKNHRILNSGHHPKEFFVQMWKQISSGKTWEGEIKNKAKDGTYYWVHTTIVPFLDKSGKPVQYVAIRSEITESKNSEERLRDYAAKLELSHNELVSSRAGEAQIRNALDESAIVAITDRAGNIIHVNKKFCEISKYSREELIGRNHRIINSRHHPREFFVQMWSQISSGKIWEGEIKNRAKDGTYYWVHTTIVPFLDDQGEPKQYVAIRYDITDIKEAEERLKIYAGKLETSNRELQDFASVAAHDLQEPLRKIQAFSDRLKSELGPAIGEKSRDYIERMETSANRMRSLINDLLTFSRVTTKAQPFLPTDLNEVIAGVLSDLEVRIEQTHGRVEVERLPVIETDALQMRQLFQNIIGNALKFHRADVSPVVRVSAKDLGSQVEIRIEDNGIGFDEKYLDKIFTIFQRLHGRHEYEGTGVGLAVCRRIAERHGGTITATSTPGVGSTFIVVLPKAPLPLAATQEAAAST